MNINSVTDKTQAVHAWNDNISRYYAGFVGYLRGYFAGDDTSHVSYCENASTNDDHFDDFDEMVKELNKTIFKDLKTMKEFCEVHPEAKVSFGPYQYKYIFRADTDDYVFLLNLTPYNNEYNFYIYCYQKSIFERFTKNAKKGIRIIDGHYKDILRLDDGDELILESEENEPIKKTCRYIDDYHFYFGPHTYHICQFGEMIERNNYSIKKGE